MADPTVTIDAVRVDDMDSAAGTGNFGAGGASGDDEADFWFQLTSGTTGCFARKVGTTFGGFDVDPMQSPAPVDMSVADRRLLMVKVIATNSSALLALGTPGMRLTLGSGSGDIWEYELAGFDFYPKKGGWIITAINPSVVAYQDQSTGTPLIGAIDYIGLQCDFSLTSKAPNVGMDSIDMGIGLCLVGGDGGSTDATWSDFVTNDPDVDATSYGFCQEIDGIIFFFGTQQIGQNASASAVETDFTDIGRTCVWPDGLFGAGDAGLQVDLNGAGTVVSMTLCSFSGTGAGGGWRFNTEDDVSTANEDIGPLGIRDFFVKGDAIIFDDRDGGESVGPVDGTRYWVGWEDGVTTTGLIELFTTRQDACTGTATPVGLSASAAGNGEIMSLNKDPDTRPVWTHIGTTGSADYTSCNWTNFESIVNTSVVTYDTCVFTNVESVTQVNASFTGCQFIDHPTRAAVALIATDNPQDFTTNTFDNTGGWGHAMEVTAAGTYTFAGNSFTGYGPDEETFHVQDDVDDSAETIAITAHPYTGGDAVVYENEGGTSVGGLTSGNTYYVSDLGANLVALHLNEGDAINDNARIDLTDGAVAEIHSLQSANAAIWNSSGGTVILNVSGAVAPTVRTDSDSVTTVNVSVDIDVHIQDGVGVAIQDVNVWVQKQTPDVFLSHASNNAVGDSTFEQQDAFAADSPTDGHFEVQDAGLSFDDWYRFISRSGVIYTLPIEVTATADVGGDADTVIDTSAAFDTDDIEVGDPVHNDAGAYSYVVSVDNATTVQVTPRSDGGTWSSSVYSFNTLIRAYDGSDAVRLPYLRLPTDASGDTATVSVNFNITTPLTVRARKSGLGTRYFPGGATGSLDSTGFSTTIVLVEDTIAL